MTSRLSAVTNGDVPAVSRVAVRMSLVETAMRTRASSRLASRRSVPPIEWVTESTAWYTTISTRPSMSVTATSSNIVWPSSPDPRRTAAG